jgi:hypothetical protein
LNPHGIATTSPSNWRVCRSTTRALIDDSSGANARANPAPARPQKCCYYFFVDPGVAEPAGFLLAGAGAPGTTFFGIGFVAGITDTGPDENGRSKILPVTLRADAYARKIDVEKKIAASNQVALVSALPAPLAPKTVWLEPPKTAPISAPFPCWSRIMMHIEMQTIM